MGWMWNNTITFVLVALLLVVGVAAIVDTPNQDTPCTTVSSYPGRSAVYQCKAGLAAVSLRNTQAAPVYTTVTTDSRTEGWMAPLGDSETAKTIRKRLGPSVVLGPGAFMAVYSGTGLVYILGKTQYLVTVAWDVPKIK